MGQKLGKQSNSLEEIDFKKFYDAEFEDRLVAQNLQFAQKRAVEKIRAREQFGWEFLAASTTTIVLLVAGSIYKRKDIIVPIVPLIMATGYRYDVVNGSNLDSLRDEADKILKSGDRRLDFVGGPISLKDVDEYRRIHF